MQAVYFPQCVQDYEMTFLSISPSLNSFYYPKEEPSKLTFVMEAIFLHIFAKITSTANATYWFFSRKTVLDFPRMKKISV